MNDFQILNLLARPRLVYDPEETQCDTVMLFVPTPLIYCDGALRTELDAIRRNWKRSEAH